MTGIKGSVEIPLMGKIALDAQTVVCIHGSHANDFSHLTGRTLRSIGSIPHQGDLLLFGEPQRIQKGIGSQLPIHPVGQGSVCPIEGDRKDVIRPQSHGLRQGSLQPTSVFGDFGLKVVGIVGSQLPSPVVSTTVGQHRIPIVVDSARVNLNDDDPGLAVIQNVGISAFQDIVAVEGQNVQSILRIHAGAWLGIVGVLGQRMIIAALVRPLTDFTGVLSDGVGVVGIQPQGEFPANGIRNERIGANRMVGCIIVVEQMNLRLVRAIECGQVSFDDRGGRGDGRNAHQIDQRRIFGIDDAEDETLVYLETSIRCPNRDVIIIARIAIQRSLKIGRLGKADYSTACIDLKQCLIRTAID